MGIDWTIGVEFFMSQHWQGPLLISIAIYAVLIAASGVDSADGA